jgi:hypothetical protein
MILGQPIIIQCSYLYTNVIDPSSYCYMCTYVTDPTSPTPPWTQTLPLPSRDCYMVINKYPTSPTSHWQFPSLFFSNWMTPDIGSHHSLSHLLPLGLKGALCFLSIFHHGLQNIILVFKRTSSVKFMLSKYILSWKYVYSLSCIVGIKPKRVIMLLKCMPRANSPLNDNLVSGPRWVAALWL